MLLLPAGPAAVLRGLGAVGCSRGGGWRRRWRTGGPRAARQGALHQRRQGEQLNTFFTGECSVVFFKLYRALCVVCEQLELEKRFMNGFKVNR